MDWWSLSSKKSQHCLRSGTYHSILKLIPLVSQTHFCKVGPSCETRWSNSDKTDHHVCLWLPLASYPSPARAWVRGYDCLILRHSNMQKWPKNEPVLSHATDQSLIAYSKQSTTGSGERPGNKASVWVLEFSEHPETMLGYSCLSKPLPPPLPVSFPDYFLHAKVKYSKH